MLLFQPGDHAFTFDLKSGYHHVDIYEPHQKFLGFEWQGRFYQFTVLPFGLSTACYIFTKLMRVLVRYWRNQGIRIVVFLDDAIGMDKGSTMTTHTSERVRKSLRGAGFLDHPEKSMWMPKVKVSWLGFNIDLCSCEITVPDEKIEGLRQQLMVAHTKGSLRARALASIVGKIIAMGLGIGPITRFMTRSMYTLLESRTSWNGFLRLTPEAQYEINFWIEGLRQYNSQPIWYTPSAIRVVYTDASESGYGGYLVEHGCHVATGQWSEEDKVKSSTWRELMAVLRVLESFSTKLKSQRIRWFTDNQNVVRILQVGSKSPHLQEVAVRVLAVMIRHQIRIEPEWIPREENEMADYCSRIIDSDDWMLNPELFSMLDDLWGPHTVDRFANADNTQIERFNSRFWCPGSEAVDAFTVDWHGENNWLCPPMSLVPRVLRHAVACKAQGTLIVPLWRSAPYWPLLCPDGSSLVEFVDDWYDLPVYDSLFLPGKSGKLLFKSGLPNTRVLALRLNCQRSSCQVGTSRAVSQPAWLAP